MSVRECACVRVPCTPFMSGITCGFRPSRQRYAGHHSVALVGRLARLVECGIISYHESQYVLRGTRLRRGLAQLVEHRSPKPGVVGSIPAAPAIFGLWRKVCNGQPSSGEGCLEAERGQLLCASYQVCSRELRGDKTQVGVADVGGTAAVHSCRDFRSARGGLLDRRNRFHFDEVYG